MVNVRCLRKERATKFGRYFSFSAAANTLSLVDCGIAAAQRASFSTTETVAGERWKGWAANLRLTVFRAVEFAGMDSIIFRIIREVWHTRWQPRIRNINRSDKSY